MSTALTYLPVARARPNLTIRSGATVDRVELSNGRATGIRLATGEVINADLIVLAGGAYASPAILARSGIGPAGPLGDLGIDVVVELEGVGANLIDHPIVSSVPTRCAITCAGRPPTGSTSGAQFQPPITTGSAFQ